MWLWLWHRFFPVGIASSGQQCSNFCGYSQRTQNQPGKFIAPSSTGNNYKTKPTKAPTNAPTSVICSAVTSTGYCWKIDEINVLEQMWNTSVVDVGNYIDHSGNPIPDVKGFVQEVPCLASEFLLLVLPPSQMTHNCWYLHRRLKLWLQMYHVMTYYR